MAMFIVKPWYKKAGFNPNDYFDPITHIATESNFIRLLNDGIYDSSLIGYKVRLQNQSTEYDNGLWIIADVNHDSANTGQTDCYDLISQDCFHNATFGSSDSWRSSTVRTWLNSTFYPGFSTDFKNHILNPKYNSQGTWYTDDKIILPSKVEVNGGADSNGDNEGLAYPIFTDDKSRLKYQTSTTSYGMWWIRSRYIYPAPVYVWTVDTRGSMYRSTYSYNYYLAPVLRVS